MEWVQSCPKCHAPFVSFTVDRGASVFTLNGATIAHPGPADGTVTCANGHEAQVRDALRDERGVRYVLADPTSRRRKSPMPKPHARYDKQDRAIKVDGKPVDRDDALRLIGELSTALVDQRLTGPARPAAAPLDPTKPDATRRRRG